MKLNKIFMALAAMAVVGCSSDDLNVAAPEQQAAEDSQLIQLDPNFAIAGVGAEDNGTRTHWDWNGDKTALVNMFLPTYNATAAAGDDLDDAAELTAEAVGLCWLGQGAVGTDVYTNYQFYHFGWLNNGETEAKLECDKLTNGSLYSDITPLAAVTNGAGGEAEPTADFAGAIPGKSLHPTTGKDNLNYNSGVYKTDNKSIFGGTYIVYYPFNKDFKNAGTIPAVATPTFDAVPTTLTDPLLGQTTFRYSSPVTIEGGAKASDFGLFNLSSLVQLRVATPADDAVLAGVEEIDQIVLYSAKEQLLKQANLAADKIVAGQKGAGLYASTEGTKTITANFAAGVTLQKTNSTTPKPTSAYITVLPTTVEDLVVLVHSNTLKKWAKVSLPNTVFEAGKAKRLDITVANADFKSDFIAVDDASLRTALTEANAVATAAKPATITVIGDITLGADLFINTVTYPNSKFINVTGDDIIVPQDVLFRLETNMVSDVRVLGRSCCTGTWGGRLEIQGGTVNNVTMEETEAKVADAVEYYQKNPLVTYSGAATVAAGKTFDVQAGNVEVKEAVKHKGNIKIAEGAKLFVLGNETGDNGDLNFMGSTVVNDGTIEVTKGGKYDMTDSDGNATATDGQRMTNNGTFIHNVDAGVGTAVQSMKQNGEYRCRVDAQKKLDDAFLQWKACSVIEMVNAGTTYNLGNACKHNGKFIDIEVNTTTGSMFNNPTPDDKEINIGNLSVLGGGLGVDYVNTVGTTTGKRTLTVNGDMTVKNGIGTTFTDSKKINIKQNLTLDGAWIYFMGAKKNEGGLAVTGDITVSGGAGNFDAGDVNALNITCANFTLAKGATASFGNRTEGDAMNMTVTGTIDNGAGCTFNIIGADQDGAGSVLAWVTCKKLIATGTFTGSRPRVE